MSKENIILETQDIFRDIFDDDSLVLQDNMNSNSIEEWDSLKQIQIIMAIESHFNICFDPEEAITLNNVSELLALIERSLHVIF